MSPGLHWELSRKAKGVAVEEEVFRLANAPCSSVMLWASMPLATGNIMMPAAIKLPL